MGIFDSVKSIVDGYAGDGAHAQVTGGLLQELGGGSGVASLIQSFQQNGAGGLIQQWAGGQTQQTSPDAIEQGLGNTGLIDQIAQRMGISPDVVKTGLTVVVPMLVHHVVSNGHVTADGQTTDNPAPESGDLLQSILGKLG